MSLFHVSCKEYQIGEIINANDFESTKYYENATDNQKNWIDDFLDNIKPTNAPERRKTVFAFDSLDNCSSFKNKCEGEVYYYKVEMLNPIGCPMCLTDALVENNEELNNRIGEEYWSPTKEWKYLEYLSSQMTVIERLPKPNFMNSAKGMTNYIADKNLAKEI